MGERASLQREHTGDSCRRWSSSRSDYARLTFVRRQYPARCKTITRAAAIRQ